MGTPEGFIIDPNGSSPLNLGNGGSLRLAALTIPPAPKRPEWASNADTDGQALVRNPYHDNRQCTMQVRVAATSMDDAMTALGTLQGKLQEACIQGAGNGPGLKFTWTPSGATNSLDGYMVYAEITDLPVTYADGWFANRPIVTVTFQCKPFLYGSEVTGPTASGTTPLTTVEVSSVPGDVPAEARLVITDASSEARRWVEWGIEQRYYDSASPAALFIDSADLVTSGYAGVASSNSSAYGGSVVGGTIFGQPVALCGTGNLAHVGTFRVKARVYATRSNQAWRLSWQQGDGNLISNDFVQPVASKTFNEIDLGLVTVEPVISGTQIWSGRIEAYTTEGDEQTASVDYLALIPIHEGYGRLEATYSYEPGVTTGWDDFSSTTAGSALSGRVAPLGGTWTTSGGTADFVFSDNGFGTGSEEITRTSPTGRFAILGNVTSTDVEVGVTVGGDLAAFNGVTAVDLGVVARYVDSNNYLFAGIVSNSFEAFVNVGGTVTTIGSTGSWTASSYTVRLVAYASGRMVATLIDASGSSLAQIEGVVAQLATGGTLASGTSGIYDYAAGSVARYYDVFYAADPASEPFIINSGKSIEVRSDSNLRESADGASYGDVPSRGSRLFIPQAGDAGRTSRIAVRAVREDPVTMASRNDGDTTDLAIYYTPRYLGVPRS